MWPLDRIAVALFFFVFLFLYLWVGWMDRVGSGYMALLYGKGLVVQRVWLGSVRGGLGFSPYVTNAPIFDSTSFPSCDG